MLRHISANSTLKFTAEACVLKKKATERPKGTQMTCPR